VASVRQIAGALAFDVLPFLYRTMARTRDVRLPPWSWNRSRGDALMKGDNGEGIRCIWEHTRELHVTKVFPRLSNLLLKRMLQDWPIELRESLANSLHLPEVSFVIGHRGLTRLPHLLLTLKSIAAQRNATVECIVVEQSHTPEIRERLPTWVRYVHSQTPSANYLYNRSWTLNEGVRQARGRLVILHDNDMLVPADYAAEFRHVADQGFDVINLKRFIAYLNEPSTRNLFEYKRLNGRQCSEAIIQNLCAGGSLGVLKTAYFAIGGMDEEFVGWGGEDTEFWDRCQTLRVANHAYLPIVHLWHASQPGKAAVNGLGSSTADLFASRMKIATADRIARLCRRGVEQSTQQSQTVDVEPSEILCPGRGN
jgi:hypothetical protein